MNKWIVIIIVLILAAIATGFYLTKNSTDSTLYPPANLSDGSPESQSATSNKNQTDGSGVNNTTSTQTPVTPKKVEPQKQAPSTIPKPPDLP